MEHRFCSAFCSSIRTEICISVRSFSRKVLFACFSSRSCSNFISCPLEIVFVMQSPPFKSTIIIAHFRYKVNSRLLIFCIIVTAAVARPGLCKKQNAICLICSVCGERRLLNILVISRCLLGISAIINPNRHRNPSNLSIHFQIVLDSFVIILMVLFVLAFLMTAVLLTGFADVEIFVNVKAKHQFLSRWTN